MRNNKSGIQARVDYATCPECDASTSDAVLQRHVAYGLQQYPCESRTRLQHERRIGNTQTSPDHVHPELRLHACHVTRVESPVLIPTELIWIAVVVKPFSTFGIMMGPTVESVHIER